MRIREERERWSEGEGTERREGIRSGKGIEKRSYTVCT